MATKGYPRNTIEHFRKLGKATHDKFFNNFPERFWKHVDRTNKGVNDCWNWTSHLNSKGYGAMARCKVRHCSHRWAWILTNGEIENGLCVLHKCDNPKCCNPNHLFLGTLKDNTRDMYKKGRENRARKLSKKIVCQIREMLKRLVSPKDICATFSVSQSTVCDIRKRRTWNMVDC